MDQVVEPSWQSPQDLRVVGTCKGGTSLGRTSRGIGTWLFVFSRLQLQSIHPPLKPLVCMKNRTLDTYQSSLAPAAQSCFPPSNQSSSASASTPSICKIATYYFCINKFKRKAQDFMLQKFYFLPVNSSFAVSCNFLTPSIVIHPSSINHPFIVHYRTCAFILCSFL